VARSADRLALPNTLLRPAGRSTASSAPAFVVHGVAAGDGYASRSAVAGRRLPASRSAAGARGHQRSVIAERWPLALCAFCDPHGPRARRGSFPAGRGAKRPADRNRESAAATCTPRSWRTVVVANRSRERGVWWASRGGEGRPAAARQEPSAAREPRDGRSRGKQVARSADRLALPSPASNPPTGSPLRARARACHRIRRQARLAGCLAISDAAAAAGASPSRRC
jgi:hypothetical protein